MGDITQKIIAMQLNLRELRSYAGWTQEELGKMLGVSKESISQLERGDNRLRQTQYVAIRSLLDHVKAERPLLSKAIDIYFGPDNWMNEVFELLKGETK